MMLGEVLFAVLSVVLFADEVLALEVADTVAGCWLSG